MFSLESVVVSLWLSFSIVNFTLYLLEGISKQEWKPQFAWGALLYLGLGSLPLIIRLGFRRGRKSIRLRRDALIVWILVSAIIFCWGFLGEQVETVYY